MDRVISLNCRINSRFVMNIIWNSDLIIVCMLNLVATFLTLDLIGLKWIVSLTHLLTTRFALLTIHFLFVAAMFESILICTSEFALIILIRIKTIHLLATRLIVMMCYIISFQFSITIPLALTSVTHILIALVFAPLLPAPDVNRCIANVTLNSISFGLEPCLVLTLV